MENFVVLLCNQIGIYICNHWVPLVVIVCGVILRYGFTKLQFLYSCTPVKTYLILLLTVIGINAFLSLAYQNGLNSEYDDIFKVLILLGYFICSFKNECKKDTTESSIILLFIKCYFITCLSLSATYLGIIIGSAIVCALTFIVYCLHKKYDNLTLRSKYFEMPLICLELIIIFIVCEQQADLLKEVLLSALITETVVFSYHPFALYIIKKFCHEDTSFYWETQMGYDEF